MPSDINYLAETTPDQPAVISRPEAKARGLKHYYTGAPCKHGHVAERMTSNGVCLACSPSIARRARANESRAVAAERRKRWRVANPGKEKARIDRWLASNPDKRNAIAKRWADANPTLVRAKYARYRAANPDKVKAASDTRRARKLGAAGSFTQSEVDDLHTKQRGKCVYCRVSLGKSYHRDHIVSLSQGGTNWISNIQLLCAGCNLKKSAKDPIAFAQSLGRLL